MNWHEKLKQIYTKLDGQGFDALSRTIHDEQMKGGTGGEIFSLVLAQLLRVKETMPQAYSVIKREVDEFIEYAKGIGYL